MRSHATPAPTALRQLHPLFDGRPRAPIIRRQQSVSVPDPTPVSPNQDRLRHPRGRGAARRAKPGVPWRGRNAPQLGRLLAAATRGPRKETGRPRYTVPQRALGAKRLQRTPRRDEGTHGRCGLPHPYIPLAPRPRPGDPLGATPNEVRRTPRISCEAPKLTGPRQLHPLVRPQVTLTNRRADPASVPAPFSNEYYSCRWVYPRAAFSLARVGRRNLDLNPWTVRRGATMLPRVARQSAGPGRRNSAGLAAYTTVGHLYYRLL